MAGRPLSRVRLSPRFHLNISFLCAIEIPRPFFRRGAPRSSVTRYAVVTPRNFFTPEERPVRYRIGAHFVRPRAQTRARTYVHAGTHARGELARITLALGHPVHNRRRTAASGYAASRRSASRTCAYPDAFAACETRRVRALFSLSRAGELI